MKDFVCALQELTQEKLNPIETDYGFFLETKDVVFLFVELYKIQDGFSMTGKRNEVFIFEDEWVNKKEIVISRIKSLLGLTKRIHGRLTVVKKITNPQLLNFLSQNHILEPLKAKYKYALFYHEEIVAVASFGQILHKKNEEGKRSGELIRFCNKNGVTVVGGLSKMLNYFIQEYQVDDVMTYIDKNWSEGNSFQRLGFKKVEEKPPQEIFINRITYHRYNGKTKPNLQDLLKIYNSGSLKMILDI